MGEEEDDYVGEDKDVYEIVVKMKMWVKMICGWKWRGEDGDEVENGDEVKMKMGGEDEDRNEDGNGNYN